MNTQTATQLMEEILRSGLSQAGIEVSDEEATLPVLLQLAMRLDEGTRLDITGEIITRFSETGETLPETEVAITEANDDETDASLLAVDWATTIAQGYLQPPSLAPDENIERLLVRQKELMETVYDGIGEEKKQAKRQGLALQQLQIEQQMALRLALGFSDAPSLNAHLQRCLDDPEFGYGERGENGRVIAQGLQAVADEEGVSLETVVTAWWEVSEHFRQQVMAGIPFTLRAVFDETLIDSFVPTLQYRGGAVWRLGVEGEGKFQDFEGNLPDVWNRIGDAMVEWTEGENEDWLKTLKQKALRLPFRIQRLAQADRLNKETWTVVQNGADLTMDVSRTPQDDAWPRFLTLGDQVGITRLNGHGFYELVWGGGAYNRRFDLNGTTQNRITIEHTELILRMGEVLAGAGILAEPANPEDVEAACLRRLKTISVRLGPPPRELPFDRGKRDKGDDRAVAFYKVTFRGKKKGEPQRVDVTWLTGGDLVACAASEGNAVVFRKDERRNELTAHPVKDRRIRLPRKLLSVPLEGSELNSPAWIRAVSAWAAWVGWTLLK